MTNPLHEAFTTFAPEPSFTNCMICEEVGHVDDMIEDFDGYIHVVCQQRCREILENDDAGHLQTFNTIFKGVANGN